MNFVQFSSVQFGSVPFKIVSMRSERPIFTPPRLSEISPTLPLNQFQCSSDRRWPSRPFKEDRLAFALSTPVSRRRSIHGMNWVGCLTGFNTNRLCRYNLLVHYFVAPKDEKRGDWFLDCICHPMIAQFRIPLWSDLFSFLDQRFADRSDLRNLIKKFKTLQLS